MNKLSKKQRIRELREHLVSLNQQLRRSAKQVEEERNELVKIGKAIGHTECELANILTTNPNGGSQ